MSKGWMKAAGGILVLVVLVAGAAAQQGAPGQRGKPMKYWSKEEFRQWQEERARAAALAKPTSHHERMFGLHDGNKVRTLFYNYGSVGAPNTEPSVEWPIYSGRGYGYEFGLLVGAEVVDAKGATVQIFSDGMLDGGDDDITGGINAWGWEPLPGYGVAPEVYATWPKAQRDKGGIAMSNRPETWGELFPHDANGKLMWPGQYGNNIIIADLESYYVMDDRWNAEFEYYPFVNDPTRRGLGIQVTARGYQYAASVAEDIIFFQFEITNVSDKTLDKVVVGMIGDPHIGGAGDFSDDWAGFIDTQGKDSFTGETHRVRNMVYSWDNPGSSNDFGIPWSELGMLGFKFLESPGVANDVIDNDGDGLVDESQRNGIDDDGDWQATDELAKADTPEQNWWNGIDDDHDGRIDDLGDLDGKSDDVGSDGLGWWHPAYPGPDPDGTEGNGRPDRGEPDFEHLDPDESDQLGLTSFAAPVYATEVAAMDDKMWQRMTPGSFNPTGIQQNQDNIFIFGSGYFSLKPGETERMSIAILLGQNKEDLLANAAVADWIYKLNFQFTKPPDPPNVWVVPGDRRVTIYWDDAAEKSVDPVFGADFEGYKIYRSNDKIKWGDPITNNRGVQVAFVPLAQFDAVNNIEGTHPVEFESGLHFYLGKNTGLVHSYTDTGLVNGLTYYYAVTAYDRGSVEGNVPPLECPRIVDGPNVKAAVPSAPAAGLVDATCATTHAAGYSTATLKVRVLDRTLVDTTTYVIGFATAANQPTRVSVTTAAGQQVVGPLKVGDIETLWNGTFRFGPYEAEIKDVGSIAVDSVKWTAGPAVFALRALAFAGGKKLPRDIEIRFFDHIRDTSMFVNPQPVTFEVWNASEGTKLEMVFYDTDNSHTPTVGDRVVALVRDGSTLKGTWEVTFLPPTEPTQYDTPRPNSVIRVFIAKPFESIDRYVVQGQPAHIEVPKEGEAKKRLLDMIAVVPNPYVSASGLETPPPEVFSVGRGERRVDFIHLPQDCTIRIYTIVGEHVATIEHHSTVFDGSEKWNLLSKDGLEIASGVYIYHVDAPGFGQKIGRLAVIK
ncbi:MAG: hypothetical protein H5U38_01085 [Calditrichaeota bacterium]|nr:hypothetical protein [Calditrichota bacterium]